VSTGRLPSGRDSGTHRMMVMPRNVPVWCGFLITVRHENRTGQSALTLTANRALTCKHPRNPGSSPHVNAGRAVPREIAQRIGDVRRGHEAIHALTCAYTEGRCSR
jgi:hypothetical protein